MEPEISSDAVYGNTLKSVRVSGLSMAETKYAPGLKVPQHSHEHGYFSLVLEGAFDGVYAGIAQSGRPFQAVFRPPDEPHSVNFHRAGARLFSLEVEAHRLEQAWDYSLNIDRSTELSGGRLAWLTCRL